MTSGVVTERCGAKTRNGSTCKRAPMIGLRRCNTHKGNSNMERHGREVLRLGMARYVTPVPADDPELDVVYGYEMELRRTLAAIRYLDEKIAELDEEAAFWVRTKQVDVNSGEFPGTDTTHEAKMNGYMAARLAERAHLHNQHKTWISAKLDERKIQITSNLVDSLNSVISAVVIGLNQNPRDPEVRRVVREAMLSIKGSYPRLRYSSGTRPRTPSRTAPPACSVTVSSAADSG